MATLAMKQELQKHAYKQTKIKQNGTTTRKNKNDIR